jgi:AAA ATPase domain
MLTGITLENFKAFKEPQFIPFKPITLVFGPNSAGKSSVMHALAFLKHVDATKGHCDPDVVEFGWEKIKLGSWMNLIHGHDPDAVMKITLHWGEKSLTWEFKKGRDADPHVDTFEIAENGRPVVRGKNQRTKGIFWSIELHSSRPSWDKFKQELFERIDEQEGLYEDSSQEEYTPMPDQILGTIDVQGEQLQTIDRNDPKWFKQGSGVQLDPYEIFSKYFDVWLGDIWRKLPLNNHSDTSFLAELFPVIEFSASQENIDVFGLPREEMSVDPEPLF